MKEPSPCGLVRLRTMGIMSSARLLPKSISFCRATSEGSKLLHQLFVSFLVHAVRQAGVVE